MKDIASYFEGMLDREIDRIIGNCTNSIANPSPPLTSETLLQMMDKLSKDLEPLRNDPVPPIFGGGMRIIESPAAVRRERVKTYPKRKTKSASHLARMDKKWRKRYGFREVPQAYFFSPNAVMHTPGGLIIHPSQVGVIKNFATSESGRGR